MSGSIDELKAEISRQRKIIRVLMDRAESSTNINGSDFSIFQADIMFNDQIKERTAELEAALFEKEIMSQELRESEKKFRALLDQSLIGVVIVERERFSYANQQFCNIFGYDQSEISSLGPKDIIAAEDRHIALSKISQADISKAEHFHYQVKGLRKDQQVIELEIYSNLIYFGGQSLRVSLINDITERCHVQQELNKLQDLLREQAVRDPLTGLFNRRHLEESLDQELTIALRQNHPVSIILSDLDHFKQINDQYGHQAGDMTLKTCAHVYQKLNRSTDITCRFGGEEFLIVLPKMSKTDAIKRAEKLRLSIEQTKIRIVGTDLSITASFGLATYPDDGTTSEEVIAAADSALYESKRRGRNQITASNLAGNPANRSI